MSIDTSVLTKLRSPGAYREAVRTVALHPDVRRYWPALPPRPSDEPTPTEPKP